MTLPPFLLLVVGLPVLLLGEGLVRRIGPLRRSNIPAPIVGGLLAAVAILLALEIHPGSITLVKGTSLVPWHWITLPQWSLAPMAKAVDVQQPLLVLFFTCIGLNASWSVAKRGGAALLVFLGLASIFAVVQGITGAITARIVGADPLLGILCSIVTLMGGFGTAAGFSPEFEKAGLADAKSVGIAAAAFGVIVGGLLAGPVAARLMRIKAQKRPGAATVVDPIDPALPPTGLAPPMDDGRKIVRGGGFIGDLMNVARHAPSVAVHLLVLLICLKAGAFLSAYAVAQGSLLIRHIPGVAPDAKFLFPVYMGPMIVAVIVRNLHDVAGLKILRNDRIDLIASIALAWMLSVYLVGLDLFALTHLAFPMLAILFVQTILMLALAYWIVFPVMGGDYEATAMSAGMVGFGLGNTSNAVATMRSLAVEFGPAPRAFLIVTVVGGFLIDFVNSVLITLCLNVFKH